MKPSENGRMRCVQTCPLATAALSGHLLIRFNPFHRLGPGEEWAATKKASRGGLVVTLSVEKAKRVVGVDRDGMGGGG